METDPTNISVMLKSKQIRPSLHRIAVYKYLVEKRNHPTIDTIYSELVSGIPTLSKTTVYNTMKLFLKHNIVSVVTIEENETRYDANTDLHGHFKCELCLNVYDIEIQSLKIAPEALNQFAVSNYQLNLNGHCLDCH